MPVTRKPRITIVSKQSHVEEVAKCRVNVFYFIWKYVNIIHAMLGVIPFRMFPFQLGVVRAILLNRYCITLKPRQMGMSTLVCAYVLWLALFYPHKKILIISIKDSVAKAMLRKIKIMYQYLPDFLKVEVVNGNSYTNIGTVTSIMFSNGSEIITSPATEDAGRSEAVSCLVMDEVAFQVHANAIWGAAYPTLSTGGQAILLSTAYGMGNFFHSTWVGAMQGLNGFFPIKLNWRMHPERNIEWYNEQRANLGEKRTAQEIDCDFLKSGYNVFDMAKIRAIEDRLLIKKTIEEDLEGRLKVYHAYDDEMTFILSADIASGRARDYSAFSIFDQNGKEYACFKGKIGIREFGHLMMKWGYKYGNAILAPEANSIGEGIISVLQENNYPAIYNTVSAVLKLEEFEKDESLVQGWFTTGKSRHEIITRMDDDLNDELVEINNPFFVQEAYTFIYNEQNRPIAMGKELGGGKSRAMYEDDSEIKSSVYVDDSILAACIGNFVRQNPGKFRGNLPIMGG